MRLPRRASLPLLLVSAGLSAQEAARAPLRILGEFEARVERVRTRPDGLTVLTLFVGRLQNAVVRGDAIRLYADDGETVAATATVVGDTRPAPASGRLHVRVRVVEAAAQARLAERAAEQLDGYPAQGGTARDAFVRRRAPRAVIRAPFEPEHGDDPAAFVVVGATGSSEPGSEAKKAQPCCSFTLRFDGPVDLSTLQRVRLLTADRRAEVPCRVFAVDDTGTRFRFEPPLGLSFSAPMREAARKTPDRPHYLLEVPGGADGLLAKGGTALAGTLELPITIDPEADDNLVGWHVLGGK